MKRYTVIYETIVMALIMPVMSLTMFIGQHMAEEEDYANKAWQLIYNGESMVICDDDGVFVTAFSEESDSCNVAKDEALELFANELKRKNLHDYAAAVQIASEGAAGVTGVTGEAGTTGVAGEAGTTGVAGVTDVTDVTGVADVTSVTDTTGAAVKVPAEMILEYGELKRERLTVYAVMRNVSSVVYLSKLAVDEYVCDGELVYFIIRIPDGCSIIVFDNMPDSIPVSEDTESFGNDSSTEIEGETESESGEDGSLQAGEDESPKAGEDGSLQAGEDESPKAGEDGGPQAGEDEESQTEGEESPKAGEDQSSGNDSSTEAEGETEKASEGEPSEGEQVTAPEGDTGDAESGEEEGFGKDEGLGADEGTGTEEGSDAEENFGTVIDSDAVEELTQDDAPVMGEAGFCYSSRLDISMRAHIASSLRRDGMFCIRYILALNSSEK